MTNFGGGTISVCRDWAESNQVPVTDQKFESGLVTGEVLGHFQSTVEVPFSKVSNPSTA